MVRVVRVVRGLGAENKLLHEIQFLSKSQELHSSDHHKLPTTVHRMCPAHG